MNVEAKKENPYNLNMKVKEGMNPNNMMKYEMMMTTFGLMGNMKSQRKVNEETEMEVN